MLDVKIKCLCLKYVKIVLENALKMFLTSHISPYCNISNTNNHNLVV